MNWKITVRQTLLAFLVIWSLLLAGLYLWSIRGLLGFRSTAHVSSQMLGGAVHIDCSVDTPIRPSRATEIACEVKSPPTSGPTQQVAVNVTLWGEGFVISAPEHRIRVPNESEILVFRVEPVAGGNRSLYVISSVAGTSLLTIWQLSIELKPVEMLTISLIFAALFTLLYRTIATAEQAQEESRALANAKIEKAEIKAESEPTKIKPAWDVARIKLEAYFDRNLSQVNQVFRMAL